MTTWPLAAVALAGLFSCAAVAARGSRVAGACSVAPAPLAAWLRRHPTRAAELASTLAGGGEAPLASLLEATQIAAPVARAAACNEALHEFDARLSYGQAAGTALTRMALFAAVFGAAAATIAEGQPTVTALGVGAIGIAALGSVRYASKRAGQRVARLRGAIDGLVAAGCRAHDGGPVAPEHILSRLDTRSAGAAGRRPGTIRAGRRAPRNLPPPALVIAPRPGALFASNAALERNGEMTQPHLGGQQPVPSGRPGQMTAVMRAVSVNTGPKVLRIGLVQSGKVIEERLVKQRTHVTVGPLEKNTFVLVAPNLPPSFRLFELVGTDYYLNFLDGMSGGIALPTGPTDLASLKGQAKRTAQGAYQLRLTDDARGRVVIGDTTVLFQFVTPPPVQPRPQLPASVTAGLADRIDWSMTIIAAFSFLFHFGAIGAFYSDWADRVVDDDATVSGLLDRINRLPPPPPVETAPTETNDNSANAAKAEATKSAGTPKGGPQGQAGPAKGSLSKSEGQSILNKLDQMDAQTVGALTSNGSATRGVLNEGNVPTGALDSIASNNQGVGSTGPGGLRMSGGGGPVTPGGGNGGLGAIGGNAAGDGTQRGSGTTTTVEGPKASVSGNSSVSVGKVSGADRVINGARGRIRACYQAGLNSNPDMEGRVSFTVSVGASGSVSNASVSPAGTINGSVVSCITGVLRGLNFDAPEGGAATVAGSFSFVNSNKGK